MRVTYTTARRARRLGCAKRDADHAINSYRRATGITNEVRETGRDRMDFPALPSIVPCIAPP
jgi:hypothetical protein